MTHDETKRNLHNSVVAINQAMFRILNNSDTWDARIDLMHKIQKLVPIMIRYMIYLKNIRGN